MTDENTDTEHSVESNGRTVNVDTGFYSVQVCGDPEDSLDDVVDAAFEAADRAIEDVEELDSRLDGNDIQYR